MPRRTTRPANEIVARQKAAADRLRRDVLGADGSLRHVYFRDLDRQVRSEAHAVGLHEVVETCARAHLVYVGDFHAVPSCQRFAADLLDALAARVPRLGLGVEFLYTRQQALLEKRQEGVLGDETFLRRIHYQEEWGYPWSGYRELLDRARDLGVPVYALDSPPRGGFEGLRRRDGHAARRIAALAAEGPERCLVVLFGESHLSRSHIPKLVRARLRKKGIERTEVSVFQDPDPLYWALLSTHEALPGAVRLGEGSFAVFHTTPLAKYEAYRQVLERWREDVPQDEEVDLTPAVHHLIGVLLGWLGIRAQRWRLHHRAGWAEDLADALPEVYSGPEAAELLTPILEEHRRSPEEIEEARVLLEHRGALYESRSNAVFLSAYLPGRAAGEGARFLRAALSGRIFDPPEETWDDPAAQAYGAAYNEALAYLGARLVDPASDYLTAEELRAISSAGSPAGEGSAHVLERIQWLEEHREFERSGLVDPPEGLLEPLRRSRRLRRALARHLGYRLGRVLLDRVRSGALDRRALRQLFSRGLTARRAGRAVAQLLR